MLRSAVPFDFHPCWFTVDPEHLLITGHFNAGLAETPTEIVRSQYVEEDVNSFADLAGRRIPAATVTAATAGDPAASWRWRHLLAPMGFDDALDAALRVRGTTWGALSLLHSDGQPPFSDEDVALVTRTAPALATGTRLGLLRGRATVDPPGTAPAVVTVSADLSLASSTPTAAQRLADLPDTGPYRPGRLPMPVQVAVVRARTSPSGEATVRLRSRSGSWVALLAACLVGEPPGQVAVVIAPAEGSQVAPLLLYAYDLSAREREVVHLVLRGRSTQQIARSLFISPYTVQDRLKSVFDKLGVRSRRELVARVQAVHAQPLLDDNDDRVRSGGPLTSASLGTRPRG